MKQRSDLHGTQQTVRSRASAVSRTERRSKVVLPANDQNAELAQILRAVRTTLADRDRDFLARHNWSPGAKKKYIQYLKNQDAWREDLYKNEGFHACLHGFHAEHVTDRKALIAAAKNLTVATEVLNHFIIEHLPSLPDSAHKWFADQEKAHAPRKKLLAALDQLAVKFPREAKILQACREQCSVAPLEPIDAFTWFPNLFDPANRPARGGRNRHTKKNGTWSGWIARELARYVSLKTKNRVSAVTKLLTFIAPDETWSVDLVGKYLNPRRKGT